MNSFSKVYYENWIGVELGLVVDLFGGNAFKSKEYNTEGIPILRMGNISKNFKINWNKKNQPYIDERRVKEFEKYLLSGGELLVCLTDMSATGDYLGTVAINDKKVLLNQRVSKFVFNESLLNKKYLFYFLRNPFVRGYLVSNDTGSIQKNTSHSHVLSTTLALPPLAEQKIIADKLDSLLAQVETIKTRLDRIPDILKRFRQSVLAAAVSGRLTEDWREINPERVFSKLGDVGVEIKTGPFGSALHKSDYLLGGIPVVNPMHISEGNIFPSESMTITESKFNELSAWHLKKGDVVVGRRGEMGRAAVVGGESDMLCGTGSMILRVPSNALPKYLEIILRSPNAINYFNSVSVGSTMVNLNQKIIKGLEVYFPPLEEQTEIVHRVEQLFTYTDKIEQQLQAATARVNNLTQSILAKAFRGELTQDWRAANPDLISGENSAAALLEKIRAERETLKPKKKTRGRRVKV